MKIDKKTKELYKLNPGEKLAKIDDRTYIVIKPGQNAKKRVAEFFEKNKMYNTVNFSAKSNADYQKVKKYNREHYHKRKDLKNNLLLGKKTY